MLNIEALDKVIAMVVVLLALSLFVQALQGWMKKLFKIKSLQIEHSLVHLYHYALNKDVLKNLNRMSDNIPLLRFIFRMDHPADRDPQVAALYNGVMTEFKKVGRLTSQGKLMLDSISQGDLVKFMGRMPVAGIIANLFPEADKEFKGRREQATTFLTAFKLIKEQYQDVAGGAEFKKIEEVLIPLLTDINKFLSGANDNSGVILDDITNLKELKPEEVRQLLTDLPRSIDLIIAKVTAERPDDEARKTVLQALNDMKGAVSGLAGGIDKVISGIAHIRALKASVETWYDTVMQSFEERYTRSMRTWTIVISAFVVILMNANIVNIYRDISSSETKRAVFLQQADKLRAPQANPSTGGGGGGGAAGGTSAGNQAGTQSPEEFIKEGKEIVDANVTYLTAIGLKGPTWVANIGPVMSQSLNHPLWVLGVILKTLLGWFIMTMLLSVGAPFWQDVLESLFGLKNKLRQQTGTKNVEDTSGTGNPKAA